MNLHQLVSSAVVDLDSTSSLLIIPVTGSVRCVEFGAVCTDTADANAAVIALDFVDGAGNVTELATATGTAAFNVGVTLRRLVDVLVERASGKHTVNGTVTTDAQGAGWLRVKVKTAGDANSNGVLFAKIVHSGATGANAATGEVIVTS
jgi:hypothetical protein